MKIPKQKLRLTILFSFASEKEEKYLRSPHSFCAPFHNSNEKPQPYKTEAATKNFSSIKLLCNHNEHR